MSQGSKKIPRSITPLIVVSSGKPNNDKFYLVTVFYREPSRETRTSPRVYSGYYKVQAPDEETAERAVQEAFRNAQLESNVGWTRKIIGLKCRILNP